MDSDVYFFDMRSLGGSHSLERRLAQLFDSSGSADVISHGDLVAVKIHFGEPGNHRLVRPQHIRKIVEKVKEAGGKPFVTDTTGIGLTSVRGTAEGCIKAALMNGYAPETLGAPIIVADGPKGLHGVRVKAHGPRLDEIEIAQAIAEADCLISVAHAKGHPNTGLGGALKNIGVGCVTKCGRAPLHLAKKPRVDSSKCDRCFECLKFCPAGAIRDSDSTITIDPDKCIWGCGCWSICPKHAISDFFEMHHSTNREFCIRIGESALAVIEYVGRDKVMSFNLAYDVTPHCDCASYGDMPIVPDVGILASHDSVAIDKASIDMINSSVGMPGSASFDLGVMEPGSDKLSALVDYPQFKRLQRLGGPDWRSMIEAAATLKIGNAGYRLIRI